VFETWYPKMQAAAAGGGGEEAEGDDAPAED
jgi:hypothetical protein